MLNQALLSIFISCRFLRLPLRTSLLSPKPPGMTNLKLITSLQVWTQMSAIRSETTHSNCHSADLNTFMLFGAKIGRQYQVGTSCQVDTSRLALFANRKSSAANCNLPLHPPNHPQFHAYLFVQWMSLINSNQFKFMNNQFAGANGWYSQLMETGVETPNRLWRTGSNHFRIVCIERWPSNRSLW